MHRPGNADLRNERSEVANLARKLFREHKEKLNLLTRNRIDSGFDLAVDRLFGDRLGRDKPVRLGNRSFVYFGVAKGSASFLPVSWFKDLDKTRAAWTGCENWWAGLPVIMWIEMRPGHGNVNGYLKLNAEIGPISDHKVRKSLIRSIITAAARGQQKIQFEIGASDKGRLYSRFLRNNTFAINDIDDEIEIEKKIVSLLEDFHPEFEIVAGVLADFFNSATNGPGRSQQ